MTETREKYVTTVSPPWTIAPPPPVHRHYGYCKAGHGYYLHIDGECVRCVAEELRRELHLETAERCPLCHQRECSH